VCGNDFATGSSIKVHCSPECRIKGAAAALSDASACWEWEGSRNPQTGYGQLSGWEGGKRKLYTAHRVSFRAFNGPIPAGMSVLHRCDNHPCFNPAHLFTGNQSANMRDMVNKGRGVHKTAEGSAHHAAKITEADAMDIRGSSETLRALSGRYGISLSALSSIRTGKTWKHI